MGENPFFEHLEPESRCRVHSFGRHPMLPAASRSSYTEMFTQAYDSRLH